MDKKDFSKMTMKEWLKILDSEQFMILREEATEPANLMTKKEKVITFA